MITVDNRQTDLKVDTDRVIRLSGEIMALLNLTEYELSLSFVGAEEMSELNGKYLNKKGTTDVLAFPLADETDLAASKESDKEQTPGDILGDVVICPFHFRHFGGKNGDVDELVKLLVHGILHLAGYDHQEPHSQKKMFGLQDEIYKKITGS